MIYLGLCEESGIMARPWADAGYRCICVDLDTEERTESGIEFIRGDVTRYLPPREPIAFVAAFPPCTSLAVSGSRWMRVKGLGALSQAIEVVDACRRICEWSGAPWMLENPVSTISTYWRKPDYTFHPFEYGDPYLKKTCLWTGGGFKMPPKRPVEPTEGQKIWKMPPSEDRARLRSKTPAGFAKAVFDANGTKPARIVTASVTPATAG